MSTERESLIRRLKEEEKKERTKAEALAKHVQVRQADTGRRARAVRARARMSRGDLGVGCINPQRVA